jgi:hypothetical protein
MIERKSQRAEQIGECAGRVAAKRCEGKAAEEKFLKQGIDK